PDSVRVCRDVPHLALPTHFNQSTALYRIEQELLDVVLLDIQHRWQALVLIMWHFEMQHFGVSVEAASASPGQTLAEKRVERTESPNDLETSSRDANGTATYTDSVICLEYHGAHTVGR